MKLVVWSIFRTSVIRRIPEPFGERIGAVRVKPGTRPDQIGSKRSSPKHIALHHRAPMALSVSGAGPIEDVVDCSGPIASRA